jgi:hypothetical protein
MRVSRDKNAITVQVFQKICKTVLVSVRVLPAFITLISPTPYFFNVLVGHTTEQ